MKFKNEIRTMTKVAWLDGQKEIFHGVIVEPQSEVERVFFRELRTKYWMDQGAVSVDVWIEGEDKNEKN